MRCTRIIWEFCKYIHHFFNFFISFSKPTYTFYSQSNAKIDSTVERLTDVSKYTGSHKQRFDETGKGKGIAGRRDVPEASGYVHGYQNKDTYSKTHQTLILYFARNSLAHLLLLTKSIKKNTSLNKRAYSYLLKYFLNLYYVFMSDCLNY